VSDLQEQLTAAQEALDAELKAVDRLNSIQKEAGDAVTARQTLRAQQADAAKAAASGAPAPPADRGSGYGVAADTTTDLRWGAGAHVADQATFDLVAAKRAEAELVLRQVAEFEAAQATAKETALLAARNAAAAAAAAAAGSAGGGQPSPLLAKPKAVAAGDERDTRRRLLAGGTFSTEARRRSTFRLSSGGKGKSVDDLFARKPSAIGSDASRTPPGGATPGETDAEFPEDWSDKETKQAEANACGCANDEL